MMIKIIILLSGLCLCLPKEVIRNDLKEYHYFQIFNRSRFFCGEPKRRIANSVYVLISEWGFIRDSLFSLLFRLNPVRPRKVGKDARLWDMSV